MGTGVPPDSSSRKKPSEDRRKRKKKAPAAAKSSKRRRHDSSSPSEYSSPSAISSDSEGGARASRVQNKRKDLDRPSQDVRSSRRQKKKKKRSYRGERGFNRQKSRSKPSKRNHQKKESVHRRCSSSRSTSVNPPDEHSSWSCSTCRSCSSSPERIKSERSRRSKGKVIKASSNVRGRSLRREKERSGRRPSCGRHRSPSCSSCSRCSQDRRSRVRRNGGERCRAQGRLTEKNCSGRSPSTSTLEKHSIEMEDRSRSGKDDNRTEIIQEFDDPHTSQSNDSYDRVRKREMTPLPPVKHASERRWHDDYAGDMRRNGYTNKVEADSKKEIISSAVVTGLDDGVQRSSRNDLPMPRGTLTRLKSEVSACGGSSEDDDLELLLRQKALENFKKFRARISTNKDSVGEQKFESIPTKSHVVVAGEAEAAAFHENPRPITVPAKLKFYTSREHNIPANVGSGDENEPALACSMAGKAEQNKRNLLQRHPGDTVNSGTFPDSFISNLDPCSKGFQAASHKLQILQESSDKKISEKGLSSKNMSTNSANTDVHKKETAKVDVSAPTDSSCQKSASEFEQKTMSVMHGREMVQVSYKVYIPKKAPALTRRQLQR
uniref:Uncharacterized protein n=1 Tax=Anthurium amnicola TaxID=1678845 RepID=A0A1D1XN35_9ARAE